MFVILGAVAVVLIKEMEVAQGDPLRLMEVAVLEDLVAPAVAMVM